VNLLNPPSVSRAVQRNRILVDHATYFTNLPAEYYIAVDPRVVSLSPYNLYDNFNNDGVTLRWDQSLGLFNLTAITHYRRSDYNTVLDADGSTLDILILPEHAIAKQYGQEVRLASDPALRVSGIVGAYYEHDRVNEVNNEAAVFLDDFNAYAHYSTTTETYAAFANLTFRLTNSLSLVGGVRKTVETRNHEGNKLYFLSRNYPWTQGNIAFDGPPPIAPDQQSLQWV
jgi:iron complex outermembrane receptor protein